MDHHEPAVFPLTAQSDLIQHKKARQVRQITPHSGQPYGDVSLRQPRRQCHVEPKLLHHVRIAPLREQRLLPRVQTDFAAACAFCLGSWGAKSIKLAHTGPSNPAHSLHIVLRCQRQKTAQSRQFQSVAYGRREVDSKVRYGGFQSSHILPFSQTKRRLQSRMKPVFARCHRDVTQTAQTWLTRLAATHNIPTKPGRAEISQGPIRRYIVNCKSRV